jgi:hypothetical protein
MVNIRIDHFFGYGSHNDIVVHDDYVENLSEMSFKSFLSFNSLTLQSFYRVILKTHGLVHTQETAATFFEWLYEILASNRNVLQMIRAQGGEISCSSEIKSSCDTVIGKYIDSMKDSYSYSRGLIDRKQLMASKSKASSKKQPPQKQEPENPEEQVVNVEELVTLLATTRVTSEGLVLEKEKEKYNRYVDMYRDIVEKCTSKSEDADNRKEVKKTEESLSSFDWYDSTRSARRFISPTTFRDAITKSDEEPYPDEPEIGRRCNGRIWNGNFWIQIKGTSLESRAFPNTPVYGQVWNEFIWTGIQWSNDRTIIRMVSNDKEGKLQQVKVDKNPVDVEQNTDSIYIQTKARRSGHARQSAAMFADSLMWGAGSPVGYSGSADPVTTTISSGTTLSDTGTPEPAIEVDASALLDEEFFDED